MKLANLSGRVLRQSVDVGSKSARNAVVLETDSGKTLILRKQGGPAFGASGFEELIGTSISAQGLDIGGTFVVRDWQPLK